MDADEAKEAKVTVEAKKEEDCKAMNQGALALKHLKQSSSPMQLEGIDRQSHMIRSKTI